MNVFEQSAEFRQLLQTYRDELPSMEERASFYFEDDKLREAWLIVETQAQTLKAVIADMEDILDATQN